MHAYDELYLCDAQLNLAEAVDYALTCLDVSPATFERVFTDSGYARKFGSGDIRTVAGMSGVSMVRDAIHSLEGRWVDKRYVYGLGNGPEYWAGRSLARYQWESTRTFEEIFQTIPLAELVGMHATLGKLDQPSVSRELERIYVSRNTLSKLELVRRRVNMTVERLSERSGVDRRRIEELEAGVADINREPAATVCKLAHALSTPMELLLETPLRA